MASKASFHVRSVLLALLLLDTSGIFCAAVTGAVSRSILVTGATGRTGQLLYAQLKARKDITEVKALVRSSSQATEKVVILS